MKKLLKVKNEESSLSGKLGGGKASAGKELSREEVLAKQKRKREREVQREKEREKEKDNLAKEREKEKEREREREKEKERKEKERERERESKVDMSRCKRVKSNDSSVIKLRGHTVAVSSNIFSLLTRHELVTDAQCVRSPLDGSTLFVQFESTNVVGYGRR